MKLMSKAFENNGMIPQKYTCDGEDISPPITWQDVPDEAKSLALIMDDPDAPGGTFDHWVIFNIPSHESGLNEHVPMTEELENKAKQGSNNFNKLGYGGPCPPSGTHRYFFKLYALDELLNLPPSSTKQDVEQAMKGHIIEETQMIGKYSRQKRMKTT